MTLNCYYVTARRLKKTPDNYAACFDALAEANLIPADLAERLRQMARFRNLVVHVYGKVDPAKVYDILHNDLDDLRRFTTAMAALVL